MASEPKEFTRPSRTGRMTGVNVTIDGETWQYVLNHAGIPIDTPLSQIKIRRYATKGKRIILKIIVESATMPETPIINESPSVKANIPKTTDAPQMPPNNVIVSETLKPHHNEMPGNPYEILESGAIQCGMHHTIHCHENNGCNKYGICPYYKQGFPDGDF